MSPKILAIISVILYAAQNVLIQRKLGSSSPVANMAYFYLPITGLSWLAMALNKPVKLDLATPDVSLIWILLATGLTLFVADYCLFSCYRNGGSVTGITILTGTLFPVFVSLINASTGGCWPTRNEFVGYCLATTAVVFVCLGEKR